MRSSSSEGRRRWLTLVVAAAVGAAVGQLVPDVDRTGALLTDRASVAAVVSVRDCDAAAVDAAVRALAPTVRLAFAAADLRADDDAAPGLPVCDPGTLAWDLDGAVEPLVRDAGLATPQNHTLAFLVDATSGTSGALVRLTADGGWELAVEVGAEGALVVRSGATTLTGPALPRGAGAHHVAVSVSPGSTTLFVDGATVATGGGSAPTSTGPLAVEVGPSAARPAAAVVVDEVLVVDAVLGVGQVRALWDAYTTW